jgi:hypothetical protein
VHERARNGLRSGEDVADELPPVPILRAELRDRLRIDAAAIARGDPGGRRDTRESDEKRA